jgi:hypothetical protein
VRIRILMPETVSYGPIGLLTVGRRVRARI